MKKIKVFLLIGFSLLSANNRESLEVDYMSEIQPIFDQYCTSCHGYAGGLNLSSYNSVINGGNSGNTIIPGNHTSSVLWQRINNGSMPPAGNLYSSQIYLIAQWIDEGALAEPNSCSLMGDFNDDGIINVMDIISTVNIVLAELELNPCVDMNDDGMINVLDILNMVNLIFDN